MVESHQEMIKRAGTRRGAPRPVESKHAAAKNQSAKDYQRIVKERTIAGLSGRDGRCRTARVAPLFAGRRHRTERRRQRQTPGRDKR